MGHLSPDWEHVAELQAQAWAELKLQNPNYKSKDVENLLSWKLARQHADSLMEKEDV